MKRSHDEAFAWRDHCMQLIAQDKPLLIAFDLDYTLWPCYCHEHTLGPYTKVDESSVLCRDRRTKVSKTLRLYPQVTQVVQLLRETNVGLSLASKSPDSTAAMGILSALELWSVFIHPQIYSGRKTNHFRLIRSATEIPYHRMLFFDDEPSNIEAVRAMGVVGCLIDKQQGLGPQVLLKGLKAYAAAQKTKSSMQRWLTPQASETPRRKVLTFSFEEVEKSQTPSQSERSKEATDVEQELEDSEARLNDGSSSADVEELEEERSTKKERVELCVEVDEGTSTIFAAL